jgi:hypothetical protein
VFYRFTRVFSGVLDGVAGFLGGVFYGVCGRGYRPFSSRNSQQSC